MNNTLRIKLNGIPEEIIWQLGEWCADNHIGGHHDGLEMVLECTKDQRHQLLSHLRTEGLIYDEDLHQIAFLH